MPNAGDKVRASDVLDQTGCRLRRVANQSVNSATSTDISFDTEDADTDGFFAPTSPTITIPAGLAGLYAITFQAAAPGISGAAFVSITTTSAITGTPAQFVVPLEVTVADQGGFGITVRLLAGDTVTCRVRHTTGSAQNFTAWMNLERIAI